jgi:hypothetical protein
MTIRTLEDFYNYLLIRDQKPQHNSAYQTDEAFYCMVHGNPERAKPFVSQVFSTPESSSAFYLVRLSFRDCNNKAIVDAN